MQKLKLLFDRKLLKFMMVGVANTIIGALVMFILYNLAHCSYWIASACNYIVGGIFSFFLNKYFTFKDKSQSFKQVLLFAGTIIFCYFVAYVLARQAVYQIFTSQPEKIKDNIAMLCGMCLYTAINYFLQRFVVFKNS